MLCKKSGALHVHLMLHMRMLTQLVSSLLPDGKAGFAKYTAAVMQLCGAAACFCISHRVSGVFVSCSVLVVLLWAKNA